LNLSECLSQSVLSLVRWVLGLVLRLPALR